MNSIFKYSIMFLTCLSLFSGCNKETDKLKPNQESVEIQLSELDQWLLENFEKPYNIKVTYAQMPFKDPVSSGNRSVQLSRVRPIMKAYKELWIDYLEKVFGKKFILLYHPKEIRLYGAPNFDRRLVEDMDTPGIGTHIMPLYNVNAFEPNNIESVYRMMREATFCFTKNMIEIQPADLIEFSSYNIVKYSQWKDKDLQGEYSDRSDIMSTFGFFTKAAQSGPVTDFSETMSVLFCQLPKNVNNLLKVDEYGTPPAYKIVLQNKVAFIDKYLLEKFGIKRVSDISRILPRMIIQYADKRTEDDTTENIIES